MSDFKAKMHQIGFPLGLLSPDPIVEKCESYCYSCRAHNCGKWVEVGRKTSELVDNSKSATV